MRIISFSRRSWKYSLRSRSFAGAGLPIDSDDGTEAAARAAESMARDETARENSIDEVAVPWAPARIESSACTPRGANADPAPMTPQAMPKPRFTPQIPMSRPADVEVWANSAGVERSLSFLESFTIGSFH